MEVVTVVCGNIGTNAGEKPEEAGGLLKPGSMWVYPKGYAHDARTGDGEAVLQVQYIGPTWHRIRQRGRRSVQNSIACKIASLVRAARTRGLALLDGSFRSSAADTYRPDE